MIKFNGLIYFVPGEFLVDTLFPNFSECITLEDPVALSQFEYDKLIGFEQCAKVVVDAGFTVMKNSFSFDKDKEFERLLDRDAKLSALEAGGVDNWEGYGYAMSEFYPDDPDDSDNLEALHPDDVVELSPDAKDHC